MDVGQSYYDVNLREIPQNPKSILLYLLLRRDNWANRITWCFHSSKVFLTFFYFRRQDDNCMILMDSLQMSSPCLVPSTVLAALQKWPHLVLTAQEEVALLPHGTEGEAETLRG